MKPNTKIQSMIAQSISNSVNKKVSSKINETFETLTKKHSGLVNFCQNIKPLMQKLKDNATNNLRLSSQESKSLVEFYLETLHFVSVEMFMSGNHITQEMEQAKQEFQNNIQNNKELFRKFINHKEGATVSGEESKSIVNFYSEVVNLLKKTHVKPAEEVVKESKQILNEDSSMVVASEWFTAGRDVIGIVLIKGTIPNTYYKAYIGVGEGSNEKDDAAHIAVHGAKFPPKAAAILFGIPVNQFMD